MQSISFDKGYKTYAINGDESNVIKINLADTNIFARAEETFSALSAFKEHVSEGDDHAEVLRKFDAFIRDKVDYTFGRGTSKAVFGDMSCLTVVNDAGECVLETFMNAIIPLIKSDMEAAGIKQNRHISEMVNRKKLDKIAADITGDGI